MDTWLKAARDQAAKLGEDIQKQASLLAEEPQNGRREISFKQGDLGFELNGTYVASVDPDGQAHQLGVQVGDRLVSIAGFAIKDTVAPETVKKWLDEMIRPGRVILVSEQPADGAEAAAAAVSFPTEKDFADSGLCDFQIQDQEDAEEDSTFVVTEDIEERLLKEKVAAAVSRLPGPDVDESELDTETRLKAQLFAARDEIKSLERDLEECRAECQELRHLAAENVDESMAAAQAKDELRLQRLQEQLAASKKETEAARKKARDVQVQLESMATKCEELRAASAQSEDRALEALEGQGHILEEEVERLRATLSSLKVEQQSSARAAALELRKSQERTEDREKRLAQTSQQNRDLERMVQDTMARAVAAETQVEAAGKDICRLQATHSTELAELRTGHERALRALQQRLEEQRAEPEAAGQQKPQSDEAKDEEAEKGPNGEDEEEEDFSVAEKTVAEETAKAISDPLGLVDDTAELRERVQFLEARCSTLQKKLNARPIVFQSPSARGGKKPQGGQKEATAASGLTGLLLTLLESKLRSFTERLLQRDAWLWVFYVHLLFLYAIAASCYTQTGGVTSDTIDVDLHSKQATLRGQTTGG